jgi:hypothetical protein
MMKMKKNNEIERNERGKMKKNREELNWLKKTKKKASLFI